ncbi:putative small lipoprotein YifL [Variovorax paradoxus]|uniref:LPS translocon maturation chaperone LptM n=1 Tax=Variovorax atrisoli TaxID=3394203 RepID=UPI0011A8801C|nr:lipoprotein [Variovorax paradoxus]MDR6519501.1 putative small lipoprotein YifL [Variovorax paradoxus]
MLNVRQILVSTRARAALMVCLAVGTAGLVAACGQRGALYLPTDPAAAGRATLPEILTPDSLRSSSSSSSQAAPAPAAAASAPAAPTTNGSSAGTEQRK